MTLLSDALNHHGLDLLTGNPVGAIEFFRAAIDEDATHADAHTNLGVALFMHHQFAEAEQVLRHALGLRPDHAETLLNLGYSLWRLGKLDDAKAVFHRTIEVGDLPTAYTALGTVYWETGDAEAAIYYCRMGLEQVPDDIVGNDTLREVYQFRGNLDDALAACDAVIRVVPYNHPAHLHKKALVRLTYGDRSGWQDHEVRYGYLKGLTERARHDAAWFSRLFNRRWDGRPTRHLLVATEQGYGDVIQFLRYISLASERCEQLSLVVPASLRRLCRQSITQSNVVVSDEVPEQFDHYCLIMSLGYLLDRVEDIPTAPYLVASQDKYGEVRRLTGLKVGLAWAGSKTHQDDHWRSMPFAKLQPLFDLPVHFVSLQFPSEVNLRPYPVLAVHPTPESFDGKLLIDWTETAALIDALDLVISVDTAVLHLAGAMGKPVWLLNRYNSDWRWLLDRADSPWYPSMHIFRQPKMGDWDPVIAEVRNGLVGALRLFDK